MACKRFIYVENLGAEETGADLPAGSPRETPRSKEPAKSAIPLIVAAMRAIGGDEDWYSLGQIGQFLTQGNPGFRHPQLWRGQAVGPGSKTGRFETKPGPGGQLLVRDLA